MKHDHQLARKLYASVPSKLEETLAFQMKAIGLPEPMREYRFHPSRKWRFDFAFPAEKVAIEAEGGVWTHGRHTRGAGFQKDLEKYNSAVILGWKVLRFSGDQIKSGEALQIIEAALNATT